MTNTKPKPPPPTKPATKPAAKPNRSATDRMRAACERCEPLRNEALEQSVIGALIVHGEQQDRWAAAFGFFFAFAEPEDFYSIKVRMLFRLLAERWHRAEPLNPVSAIIENLRDRGEWWDNPEKPQENKLDTIDIATYVDQACMAASITHCCRQLRKLRLQREIVVATEMLAVAAMNGDVIGWRERAARCIELADKIGSDTEVTRLLTAIHERLALTTKPRLP